jgi:hypothetical protein
MISIILRLLIVSAAVLLTACGLEEEKRAQDSLIFKPKASLLNETTFSAMASAPSDVTNMGLTSRWAGILNGAAYQVEVPPNWNGMLVMYAHGYLGPKLELELGAPSIRRHLIQNGYAWAASSYTKNNYDVRAGIEDTNALALEFTKIAAKNSRPLAAPSKIYITGLSMGGHIAAAAIESETYATSINKVRYNGAVPMCGVVGDVELFNQFAAMQVTAQALAGKANHPIDKWPSIKDHVTSNLFTTFPSVPTATGRKYLSVVQNITGGPRPMFDLAIDFGRSFISTFGFFGSDGTVTGVLNKSIFDTNEFTYTIDGDPAGSTALNNSLIKLTGAPDANRLRYDGLRWIPKVNGEFHVPVVTIHTLGDLFVPFSMEQIYQKRAAANGNSKWLVQRAIRGVGHCDFTVAEQVDAFDAMVKWEQGGLPPGGDDVVTPATIAATSYGCTFTKNTLGPDEIKDTREFRPKILAKSPCPTP